MIAHLSMMAKQGGEKGAQGRRHLAVVVIHHAGGVADLRLQLASRWLQEVLGEEVQISPLTGDASSRRYFRIVQSDQCWILMDAPPQSSSVEPFIRIGDWLIKGGVRVPKLVAENRTAGLLLLEDLGDVTWAEALMQGDPVEPLMADAMAQLLLLQALDGSSVALPCFDTARMERECALYVDWYLPYVRGKRVSDRDRAGFFSALSPLFSRITNQPQVAVHLDYHSRNLMLPASGFPLGVIDFQDACVGPIGYDISSIIYDCYQCYSVNKTDGWSRDFYEMLPKNQRDFYHDWEDWHHALLITSLQRHIKVCGIFVRLAQRDGKAKFLESLSQTRAHLMYEVDALAGAVRHLHPWLLDSA
ncbi:MAG: phosphotransferase [Mariprofundales bacterium]